MGGCEIPLTDPSVAPLAPNIPFVAITFRDHLRSGGRAADADWAMRGPDPAIARLRLRLIRMSYELRKRW